MTKTIGSRTARRAGWAAVALSAGLVGLAPAAGAAPSSAALETLDGAGGPDGRTTGHLGDDTHAVVLSGVVHVFTYDASAGDLRHGWRQGPSWRFETVDGSGGGGGRVSADVGRTLSAVVDGTSLHVFYADVSRGDLRQATLSAQGAWRFATLDGAGGAAGRVTGAVGGGSSSAVLGGRVNVFYADGTRQHVRRAVLGPAGWSFTVLDGAGGSGGRRTGAMGGYTRVAVVAGVPHVLYTAFDGTDPDTGWQWGVVRDARLAGGSWTMTDVARSPWPYGRDLSAQTVGGQLFVALTWAGETVTTPKLWRLTEGAWGAVPAPPCQDAEIAPSCTLAGLTVTGGRLAVLYDDAYADGTGALRAAQWTGSAWSAPRTLDATGAGTSAVVVDGRTTVFYTSAGDLRSALLG